MFEKRKKAPIISVIGAGGKTTIINKIASFYEQEGRKAIITTTTHMERQNNWKNSYTNSTNEIADLLKETNIIMAGTPCEENKVKMLKKSVLSELVSWDIPLLIEADGAKHMPLKVPREKEPVIIPETTVVIAVVGLDALDKPIEECCFCAERAARLLNCSVEKKLTCNDVCKLLLSPYGLKKGVADNMQYCVVLNKKDRLEYLESGYLIRDMLKDLGQSDVYII